MNRTRHASTLALVAGAALAASASAQNCQWDFTHSVPGMDGTVNNLLVFNGSLYATGGSFTTAGGAPASRFARWIHSGWEDVAGGLDRGVNGYAIGDIGAGPRLFLGGPFAWPGNKLVMFDGTSFTDVGGTFFHTSTTQNISSVVVWNNAVYVGGAFNTDASSPSQADRLARWDGTNWQQVGVGIGSGSVTAMAIFQGHLHIVGTFTSLGDGTPFSRGAARWDGTTFHPLGSGLGTAGDATSGALVWDDGIGGESLYVHGSFASAGGVTVNGIGRWDGNAWHALAGPGQSPVGLARENGSASWVRSATIFDDGTGPAIFVGSSYTSFFTQAGGIPARFIAKWDGQMWSAATDIFPTQTLPNPNVFALQQFNDPTGEHVLWVGGQFTEIGGNTANRIARRVCEAPPGPDPCYANCDNSTTEPILNVEDFVCFISEFAVGISLPPEQQITHYANCDESTTIPILNVEDFICFIALFAQGCP
jgi:hypothetical protein